MNGKNIYRMNHFSEQLIEARKKAKLTQEQLAEKVHVTRAAISHWENGRYLPDFDMIRELSKALDYHFETDARPFETGSTEEEGASETKETTLAEAAEKPGEEPSSAAATESKEPEKRKKAPWILAGVALTACLALILILVLSGNRGQGSGTYASDTDPKRRFSIEDYRAVTPREAGKPYLVVNTESRVERGDNKDFWMYAFKLQEDQGFSIHLNQMELIYFSADHAHPMYFTENDMELMEVLTDLQANQSTEVSGGCPLDQASMLGAGLKVTGQDEQGVTLSFTGYIDFPNQ